MLFVADGTTDAGAIGGPAVRRQEVSAHEHASEITAEVHVGECLEVMRSLNDESVDVVIADPPYFLSNGGTTVRSGKRASVDKGLWDRSSGLEADHRFNVEWMTEARRVLRPDGTMWISGTMHNIYSIGFAACELEMRILNDVIWFKPNAPFNAGCRSFTHSHETLLWLSKSTSARHIFNYPWTKQTSFPGDKLKNDGKQMRSVWSIPVTPARERIHGTHPTQKPEALLERIILSTSNPTAVILDPFAGSGTTGAVAVRHGRSFIGIEIDEHYALDVAVPRITAELPAEASVKVVRHTT